MNRKLYSKMKYALNRFSDEWKNTIEDMLNECIPVKHASYGLMILRPLHVLRDCIFQIQTRAKRKKITDIILYESYSEFLYLLDLGVSKNILSLVNAQLIADELISFVQHFSQKCIVSLNLNAHHLSNLNRGYQFAG